MHKTNCMQSIENISTWEVFSSICPKELLSAIVKLRHLQPSCWLGNIVDFCFAGSHAEKFI